MENIHPMEKVPVGTGARLTVTGWEKIPSIVREACVSRHDGGPSWGALHHDSAVMVREASGGVLNWIAMMV